MIDLSARPAVRACAVLALATGAVISTGGASTASANPVGFWQGTVTRQDGSGTVKLTFLATGRLCLTSSEAGSSGRGTGSWTATGTGSFSYRVREYLFDSSGASLGFVDVSQQAVLSGRRFTSSGISEIYDAGGSHVGSAKATVEATRRVGASPSCGSA